MGQAGAPPAAVAALPQAPGVYRFRDARAGVLYLGRAVNLRRRVASYWGDLGSRGHLASMVARIARVQALVCDSEHEAAWLERNLLERRLPRWNRTAGRPGGAGLHPARPAAAVGGPEGGARREPGARRPLLRSLPRRPSGAARGLGVAPGAAGGLRRRRPARLGPRHGGGPGDRARRPFRADRDRRRGAGTGRRRCDLVPRRTRATTRQRSRGTLLRARGPDPGGDRGGGLGHRCAEGDAGQRR